MRPRHTAPEVVPGPADIEGGQRHELLGALGRRQQLWEDHLDGRPLFNASEYAFKII